MTRLVRSIRPNGLDYNPNRNPWTTRRPAGSTFRIHARLGGGGSARVELVDAQGHVLRASFVALPGEYTHGPVIDAAGARRITLKVSATNKYFAQDLNLEVAHPE